MSFTYNPAHMGELHSVMQTVSGELTQHEEDLKASLAALRTAWVGDGEAGEAFTAVATAVHKHLQKFEEYQHNHQSSTNGVQQAWHNAHGADQAVARSI
ncbi:WXG100 family type VII secretion target [Nocardia sp. CA-107356]|uniref:WXG100 family type VII secretion target n=1 Tax=Nocardia sp. CA-107356 TaxID=3239972 RepID=UPI003D8C859E